MSNLWEGGNQAQALGRSRGGLSTKIHLGRMPRDSPCALASLEIKPMMPHKLYLY
jgi:hypothetical protein